MKFEDVYGRCYRGDLSQAEASAILGMSERTFRRWRERYEAEGVIRRGNLTPGIKVSQRVKAPIGVESWCFGRSQRLASLGSCSASEFPCFPWKIPCLANNNSLFVA